MFQMHQISSMDRFAEALVVKDPELMRVTINIAQYSPYWLPCLNQLIPKVYVGDFYHAYRFLERI